MINNHKVDLKNKLFLSSIPENTDQHSPYTAKVFIPSQPSTQTDNASNITAKTYQMNLLESPEELKINSMMNRTLELKNARFGEHPYSPPPPIPVCRNSLLNSLDALKKYSFSKMDRRRFGDADHAFATSAKI